MDTTMDSNDGVQQYVKALGRWLIKNGHDVKFLVGESKDEGEFAGRIISLSKNINIKSNANKLSTSLIPNLSKINKVLAENKFDIVHVQMPYSPFMAGVVLDRVKCPIIATFCILPASRTIHILNKVISATQQRQYRKISKLISVSKAAQKFVKDVYKQDSIVIPNMVDIEKFQGKPISDYSDGKVNIMFFGRLVPRKGPIYLLKAYANIIKEIDPNTVRLIIAGDGFEREKLQSYVRENNISNVVFTGYVKEEEKGDMYNTADICVFPATTGESFGIVLIEAMAAGKPIVVFDNPGYRSVMEDSDSSEWIAKNKNIDDLTEKILTLVRDNDLREKVGGKNKEEVKKYDTNNVCQKILEIYSKIIWNE